MRKIIFWMLLFTVVVRAQETDTIDIPFPQFVDQAFVDIEDQFTTGYLENKTLGLDSNVLEIIKNTSKPWNANHFYTAYNVLDLMATDTNFIDAETLYEEVHQYVMETEWELDLVSVPIFITDIVYENFNDSLEIANNTLSFSDGVVTQNAPLTSVEKKKFQFLGPMYDYKSETAMELYFDSAYFLSNYRTTEDVRSIEVSDGFTTSKLTFGESFVFMAQDTSIQKLRVTLMYNDKSKIEKDIEINTPFLQVKKEKFTGNFFEPSGVGNGRCPEFFFDEFEIDQNKLQFCYIPSCSNFNLDATYDGPNRARIKRPFIFVTGWRPPIVGQSFETTWENYSTNHNDYLATLREYDYDIFLIRFNVHSRPGSHGMLESAELLEQFINEINNQRKLPYEYENVIQGSSMGSDIVRLCLLQMEKKHFDGLTDNHHHCRLNMNYDGNFYGANVPLSIQYQVKSFNAHITLGLNSISFLPLHYYLNATLNQKSYKQLIAYHPNGSGGEFMFNSFSANIDLVPNHHEERQVFLNALASVDNGSGIIPIPKHTRNSAISLGIISGLSSQLNETDDRYWYPRLNYFRNVNVLNYQSRMMSGTYLPPGQYVELFKRRLFAATNFGPFPVLWQINHRVRVSQMEELDNAPGSYLTGLGNLIGVSRSAYFGGSALVNAGGDEDLHSHKSVNTALAINQNLWPSNGSHSNNLHGLKLMGFQKPFDPNIQSEFYGYPNIGRPNDHFNITPFEAIYCDREPDPHIDLIDVEQPFKVKKNEFLLDEIRPFTVEIQNTNVGSQVRPDITYISRRDALDTLKIGKNVSVKTDVAPVNVLPNAIVRYYAQEIIEVKPGTHFTAGSTAHLNIQAYACFTSGKSSLDGVLVNEDAPITLPTFAYTQGKEKQTALSVTPNPNTGIFTISGSSNKIMRVALYTMSGQRILFQDNLDTQIFRNTENLHTGIYIAKVKLNNNTVETLKIIVQ